MKKLILIFCLSFFLYSQGFDEFLGLSGTKLNNDQDFDIAQKKVFDYLMKKIELIKDKLTKEEFEMLSRYYNIAASKYLIMGPISFPLTPANGKELYYIIKGKNLYGGDLSEYRSGEELIEFLKKTPTIFRDLMTKVVELFENVSTYSKL